MPLLEVRQAVKSGVSMEDFASCIRWDAAVSKKVVSKKV
jgi:hypothetical protein